MPSQSKYFVATKLDEIKENKVHMLSAGVDALGFDETISIVNRVRNFNDFNVGNDHYGEHDFGSFNHNNNKIFWKIDYYDNSLKYGSENPANPSVTTRILTIMLAEEY